MKKNGFTLLELLVVIVILGLLITLGSKSLRAVKRSAKRTKALVEIKSIETALNAYQNKYGKLPAPNILQGREDLEDGEEESQDTLAILMAEDSLLNPAQLVFLETQGSSVAGVFVDPWGSQYKILLDTDYDGFVDGPVGSIRRAVAVYSDGLYILMGSADTNDFILSW